MAYKGNIKVNILDRKTFDQDIITNIDDCMAFLKRHLNLSYEITSLQRKEKLGLPKGLNPEDFGKRTLARNPLIAALLLRAKYIEKLGTGIFRMRQEMQKAELPEPEFSYDGFFTITFKRMHTVERAITLSLNVSWKRLERMMYLIKQLQTENSLDIKEVSGKLGVIEKSVRQDLMLLNKNGWIISSGTTTNRNYQLSEQAKELLDPSRDI